MIQSILATIQDILGGRLISPFESFGVDPFKFIVQSIIFLVPTVWATLRVIQFRSGLQLAGWLVLIWFFPFIGAIFALLVVTSPKKQNG